MVKLHSRQRALLREALRRYTRFHKGESLTEAWTGLGSASEYAPAVNAEYMSVATTLNPGFITWWRLTERGASIVLAWLITGEDYQSVES